MRVLKDITTPLRFFPAGVDVALEDLDGPMTVEDWQRLGHLEAPAAERPARPAKPAVTPAEPREGN
jgi:hypothetical protein